MNKPTMKIAIISGYFDPIHSGHVDNIRFAAKYGKVIAIINNDQQAILKKKHVFIDQFNRQTVVENLKKIYKTYLSIDTDPSVCNTLAKIANDFQNCKIYFCKSGDRNLSNIPEVAICKKHNIEIVVDNKSVKKYSSSLFLKNWVSSNKH